MHRRRVLFSALPVSVAVIAGQRMDTPDDGFDLAVGRQGAWDSSVAALGDRTGIFAHDGVGANIRYTADSDETLQAVLSRRADIGVGVEIIAAMDAFARGAPLRIVGNQTSGSADLFWYVAADSPITAIQDCTGRSIAYSAPGSDTNSVALGFAGTFGIKPDLVASGSMADTLAQVRAGTLDVGWAAAPFLLDEAQAGSVRILADGDDVPSMRGRTRRVIVAHRAVLAARPDQMWRFMRSYRQTVHWMYTSPVAARTFADYAGIKASVVPRLRAEFFPRDAIWPDRIGGLADAVADGVRAGYLPAPLAPGDLARLIRIPSG